MLIVIYLLMKKNYKSKADNKNANFPTQFYLATISNKFDHIGSRKISLNGNNLYDFSVDYNAIHKSDKLNIHA